MQRVSNSNFPISNPQAQIRETNITNTFSPDFRATRSPQPFVTQVRPVTEARSATTVGNNNFSTFQNNFTGSRVIGSQIVGPPRIMNNNVQTSKVINLSSSQIQQIPLQRQTFVQPQQVVFNPPHQIINSQNVSRPSIAFSQIIRQNQPQTLFQQQITPQTIVQQKVVDNSIRPMIPTRQQTLIPLTQIKPEVEERITYVRGEDPMVQTRHSNWQSYYQNKKPLEPLPITTPAIKDKTVCSPWLFIPFALLALGGLIAGIVLALKKGQQPGTPPVFNTGPGVPTTPIHVKYPNYTITVQTTVLDQSNLNDTLKENKNITTNTIKESPASTSIQNVNNLTTKIITVDPITVPPTITTIINNRNTINASSTSTSVQGTNNSTSFNLFQNNTVANSITPPSSIPAYSPSTIQQIQIPPQYVQPIAFQAWQSPITAGSVSDLLLNSNTNNIQNTTGVSPSIQSINANQQAQPLSIDSNTQKWIQNPISSTATIPLNQYQIPLKTQQNSFSSSSISQNEVQPMLVEKSQLKNMHTLRLSQLNQAN